jgi:anaerobic selenocysteine-containing dehydrogenase
MEARTTGLLEMHPTDAAARGLATGDAVEVFNARGSIQLRAQVGEMVPQGVVAARLNWNKLSGGNGNGHAAIHNVNALTSETLTDIGAGATFYSTLVEVRKSAN